MAETQGRLSREMESRKVSMRPETWRPPETLPMPDDRPGWKHRYIRISYGGQSDVGNISSKLREGYEFCKAEEYPELMALAATEGRFKGNIEIGGLVLCRIPIELLQQRADYYSKQNNAQMESVDNTYLRDSDPRMPLFKQRESKVTFGSGS